MMLLFGDWKSPNPSPQSDEAPDDILFRGAGAEAGEQKEPAGHDGRVRCLPAILHVRVRRVAPASGATLTTMTAGQAVMTRLLW